jgi:hypothetical protein
MYIMLNEIYADIQNSGPYRQLAKPAWCLQPDKQVIRANHLQDVASPTLDGCVSFSAGAGCEVSDFCLLFSSLRFFFASSLWRFSNE